MNKIQELQFQMLIKLDEVCRKHNLTYYLAYGTCLGAVRHKGFIPWDHDVDVLMPFDDARKLVDYQSEFEPDYHISNFLNDPGNLTTKVLLYDNNHYCRAIQNGKVIETGKVYMDIYPLYNCPHSRLGLLLSIWRSHEYKILVGGAPKNHGRFAKTIGMIITSVISIGNKDRAIKRIESKLNYKGKSYEVADYYGYDVSLMSVISYNKEWFAEPSEMEFEGRFFYGPTDADKYLTKRFGDYMTPVSKKEIEKETKIELIDEV